MQPDNKPGGEETKSEQDASQAEQAVYPGVKNCIFKSGAPGSPSVSIYYPEFGNSGVDAAIKDFAQAQGSDYEKDVQEATEGGEEKPSNYDMWEMAGFYSLERPTKDIVSVTFNIYSYSGGAHGNLFIRCLNFDLETGAPLQFKDLFKDQEKALAILSQVTAEKLRVELGEEADDEMISGGTAPELNNFLNLSLTPQGVTVEFQPYQVGPWSIGPQSIPVALDALMPAGPNRRVWPENQDSAGPVGH